MSLRLRPLALSVQDCHSRSPAAITPGFCSKSSQHCLLVVMRGSSTRYPILKKETGQYLPQGHRSRCTTFALQLCAQNLRMQKNVGTAASRSGLLTHPDTGIITKSRLPRCAPGTPAAAAHQSVLPPASRLVSTVACHAAPHPHAPGAPCIWSL